MGRSPKSPWFAPALGFPFLRRNALRLWGIIKGGQIARFFPWRILSRLPDTCSVFCGQAHSNKERFCHVYVNYR